MAPERSRRTWNAVVLRDLRLVNWNGIEPARLFRMLDSRSLNCIHQDRVGRGVFAGGKIPDEVNKMCSLFDNWATAGFLAPPRYFACRCCRALDMSV